MLIYQDTTRQFIQDVRENQLSDIMAESFRMRYGHLPHQKEYDSWQQTLPRVRDILEIADLSDNIIALEYDLPYSQNSRIDCLLFGQGEDQTENVVLIELKGWREVRPLADEGNFVETHTGKPDNRVAHPSQQVKGYHDYMKSFITEFENDPSLMLFSCSYCPNYSRKAEDGLFHPVYEQIVRDYPVYTKADVKALAQHIKRLLQNGSGFEVFNRFMSSPVKPSKKLLDNVRKVIEGEVVFSLLNEQLVAKNLIWAKVRSAKKRKQKSVIIVHGGPGTGKSVIAVNVLAEAARLNQKVFYGCKSKPFTEGLKKLVGKGGEILFSNLYRFLPAKVQENELDLLLIDEAHRIEKNGNNQYTPKEYRSDLPQIDQLIRCAQTAVFFIDDRQNVRSSEIGNSQMIRDAALQAGVQVDEVVLETQYRCMGSNNYLEWIDSMMGYTDEKKVLGTSEKFDFRIFDSPQAIYDLLKEKEAEKPNSARMVAGFCWPWSKSLDENKQLVKDIKIGDFEMPWETHGDLTPPKAMSAGMSGLTAPKALSRSVVFIRHRALNMNTLV